MSRLDRSRNLLALLTEALEVRASELTDPLLESVAVNYLLTSAYAEVETAIRDSLVVFAREGAPSPRTVSFAQQAVKRVVRSIKCSDLAGTLGMFGEEPKRHFQELVNNTRAQAAFDRIVDGRHNQAHGTGSSMTLRDFAADLEQCESILEGIAASLRCTCHRE